LRTLFLSITAIILSVLPATAADLLIVQSQHREVYEQAIRLMQNKCAADSELLVMSDYAEFDLGRIVREEQPRLMIAVGDQALKEARKLRRTPVVYALTLNVDESSLGDNINGVSMHVAPELYLKLFKKLQLHRIGMLYDPRKSGAYLKRVRDAFAGAGVELVPLTVHSPREVPAALERLQALSIDSLWMIPDSSAVAPASVDAYFHFAQQQSLPVISFARGYLAKGAVAALEGSRTAIADQSCAIVKKIRNGVPAEELSTVDINTTSIYTNENVAAKLQLKLSGLDRLFSSGSE
jgi:putative ABC transport system substrate-binding protein